MPNVGTMLWYDTGDKGYDLYLKLAHITYWDCLRGITIGAGIESDVGGASAYDKQMKLITQPSHWVSANYSVISVIM